MILTVDIGNSQIELGIFEEDRLVKSWRISTGIDRTEDEYMVFLSHILNMGRIAAEQIRGVALASVVPNKTYIFEKMCKKYFNLTPLVADHTLQLGLKILYVNPAAVGADRLCSAVAAFQKFRDAVVVVDFGTATTFDIVNGKAEYMGGIISPGIETTAWALYQRAAKLPKISLEMPPRVIGRSTEESMQAGIMIGTVKIVDGLLEEITREMGEKPRVIATGGLARLIQEKSKYIQEYFPHLVLEGLYKIYTMNC